MLGNLKISRPSNKKRLGFGLGRRRRTAAGARVGFYFLGNVFEEKISRILESF